MKNLYFKTFMKKYNLRNATMNKSELQRVYNYHMHPRDSKIHSDRKFINIDNGSRSGTHWICFFFIKDTESFYCDSFGGEPDKTLHKQLPNLIKYHNYKIQEINSKLCGSFSLYFLISIERMKY